MTEIPALLLLNPEELPKSYRELQQRRTTQVSSLRNFSRPACTSLEHVLREVCCSLSSLGEREFPPAELQSVCEAADSDSHDEYCRIRRVEDPDTLYVFTRSILKAYEELLEDTVSGGSSLTPDQWIALRAAFERLIHLVAGPKSAAPVRPELPGFDIKQVDAIWCDPLSRWIRGHHVFLVLIQGLIVAINCLINARAEESLEDAFSALEAATLLMDGSSASLHYAGDFPTSEYDDTVRPTMMPPNVPPGMSGILARDHRHLIKLLQSQRDLFQVIEPSLRSKYEEFVTAFGCTYDAHKLVCAHFRGDERPSLLNGNAAESGVELLDDLKSVRLRSLGQRSVIRKVGSNLPVGGEIVVNTHR
ncbi:MAG TPA: hypothetical protein VGO56_15355 [Pyrinomonadaceae bacterium]|jgi:hypothetical protein|nr:hypothetical protein [Pyrinomonadaceae bacterium]